MRLITWNIQCGKGCDGVTDLARIVAVAKADGRRRRLLFSGGIRQFSKLDGGADQSAQLGSAAARSSAGVSAGDRNDRQRGRITPVRQHDAVAPAGAADRQSSAAVAGSEAPTAACAVTRWRLRSRPRSVRCGSSTRISNITPPISAKRRSRGCSTCSRKHRPARGSRFPTRRALREPDAGGIEPAVRRFQFRCLRSAACAD